MSNVKISQLPSATTPLDGTEEIPMVQNSQTVKATIQNIRGGYKVYTALLTQSGTTNVVTQGIGSVTKGVTYQVDSYFANTDFSNVGGGTFNNPLQYFVATATATPNDYDGSILTSNTAAPVVASMLENTIGNIWFTYTGSPGVYNVNSSSLFTASKTWTNTTLLDNINLQLSMYRNTDSLLYLVDANGDGGLLETSIEIRVYN